MWKFMLSKISEYKSKCARCVHIMFWGQILKWGKVLTILGTPAILIWYWNAIVKILRGAKSVAPKIEFLWLCARIAFLARTKFLRQPLVTLKTFVSDRFSRLFLICSKHALVKWALPPSSAFRHFFGGTIRKLIKKCIFRQKQK